MYSRVLIPLDGSDLAEGIVPFAEQVAGPADAELVVLRVVEPISPGEAMASAGFIATDAFALREEEAKRYLHDMEGRLSKKGRRVRTRMAFGPPAEEILAAVKTTGVDLIAMATHGRSGLRRVLFGSVAEAVLRASPVPVLLIRVPAKVGENRDAH